MTRDEFAAVMAYIASGCGKALSAPSMEVYYDLLGDLPLAALQCAAKRALIESTYPVFPPVGTLRQIALESIGGKIGIPTAAEAWGMVCDAIAQYGWYKPKQGLSSLPGPVRRAAECLGWRELCDSTKPEISRAQFMAAYEPLAKREASDRLLPAPVRALREALGEAFAMPEEPKRLGRKESS